MIGWPIRMCCWYTSRMKFGTLWWPNSWLKMSTQVPPHDGVAAFAVAAVPSTPAVPTPPTMVSVAAVASSLLLMDMKQFLSWNLKQPYPAYGLSRADQDGNGRPDRSCGKRRRARAPQDEARNTQIRALSHYSARFITRRTGPTGGLPGSSGVIKSKLSRHLDRCDRCSGSTKGLANSSDAGPLTGNRRHRYYVTYLPTERPEVRNGQISNRYGPKSAPHIWLSSMLG